MTAADRINSPGPKKILTLDGGGIRGMMTVEVLAKIETLLRERLGRGDDFVLADYFDFVAGTSTGAIIAASIALGMKVDEIRAFYVQSGAEMFDKASVLKRLRYRYEDDKLAERMQSVFGKDTTLGSDKLKTVLMMVMRNASTDSPWPVSNNPGARYNRRARPDGSPRDNCNLDLPLWQLVRASTAAPVYFPPEVVKIGTHEFVFVDGGITPYNNPAFQAFLMATVEPYAVRWPSGERADAGGVDRHRHQSGCQSESRTRQDEPAVQRRFDPLGADARQPQRTGSAVPRVRQVSRRRSAGPRSRRSDRRPGSGAAEAVHLCPL